jgi:hypothetical protein
MALIFLASLTIIIERLIFFCTSVRSGIALEYDLKKVEPSKLDEMHKPIDRYQGSVQGELIRSAVDMHGQQAERFEREVEKSSGPSFTLVSRIHRLRSAHLEHDARHHPRHDRLVRHRLFCMEICHFRAVFCLMSGRGQKIRARITLASFPGNRA